MKFTCNRKVGVFYRSVLVFIVINIIATRSQTEYPPHIFRVEPESQNYLALGATRNLVCRATSNPASTYGWLKDDVLLSPTSNIEISEIHLGIRAATQNDTGIYRCLAKNDLGTIMSKICRLTVSYMEDFSSGPVPVSVTLGHSAIIHFPQLRSYPMPEVTWLLGSAEMNSEAASHQVSFSKDLILLDTTASQSGSQYKVSALNVALSKDIESLPATLTVTDAGNTNPVPPEIIVPPANTVVKTGDFMAEFECIANARPLSRLNLVWYRVLGVTKTEITASNHYSLSSHKRIMTILGPVQSDEGEYRCEASLSLINGPSFQPIYASANLTVLDPPQILAFSPGEYTRDFGQNIEIPCKTKGSPNPTVHWYFNAVEIGSQSNNDRVSVSSEGTLRITNLDLDNGGIYQCFARNQAGEVYRATWLKVNHSPPQFLHQPANLSLVEGTDARFLCDAVGAPQPVVRWFRVTGSGQEALISQSRIQILDRGELLIALAETTDSGIYYCNATNTIGSISAEAYFHVWVPTRIINPPMNHSAILGSTVEFPCGISHDPDVSITITWMLRKSQVDGDIDVEIAASGRHKIDIDGTLTLTGANSVDIGYYMCRVMSVGGNDSHTAFLEILELPRKPITMSVELYLIQPKSVNVTWIPGFDGHSPTQYYHIQYRIVNQVSDKDSAVQEDVGWVEYRTIPANPTWFIVPNLRPASRYQFRLGAVNSVGQGEMSLAEPYPPIQMPEMPPSAPPKGFFGSPHTNSSIILRWQAPDEDTWNGNLLGYTIGYIPVRYPNISYQKRNVINIGVTQYIEHVLTGLSIFQDYKIEIAAFNRIGIGVFSDPIVVWTMEGVPTVAPLNVMVVSMSSTSINVTWSRPDNQHIHGINQGYIVEAAIAGVEGTGIIKSVSPVPYESLQFTVVTNLFKYTEYSITVLCYTSQGNGPQSPPFVVHTQEDVPGPVGSLTFDSITSTSIRVLWTPPQHVNGVLRSYTLMFEKKNQTASRQELELQADDLKYTIYQLSPTTVYTIYVFAYTNKGPGLVTSAEIESGVPPELPGPPHNLGISNTRPRTVLLQFLQGYNGKTSITNWIVQALEVDSAEKIWNKIYEISDPDATAILVQNLRPFTNYQLKVIAVNVVGQSKVSIPTRTFQTMQDAPEVSPGSLTVRAVNATSLRISWAPLTTQDWNGLPLGYKIHHRTVGVENYTVIDLKNGFNSDSYTLRELEEWTQYQVKMLSYNDVGHSQFSEVVLERTKEAVPTAGPSDVAAEALSSTSINVTWGDVPLLDRNGMIIGYKIDYAESYSGLPPLAQDVPGNSSRSHIINNLRKYVYYDIQVLAYTRMGDGIPSTTIKERTFEDVPGPPVIIWFPEVTYTTAMVVWNAPLEPNGIIDMYRVSYKDQQNNGGQVARAELGKTSHEYTANDLKGATYYEFSVVARTQLGWGEQATVTVITMVNRTIPGEPSEPQILIDQIHARNVTISWQPGGSDGYSPLRNYTIQYQREADVWMTFDQYIAPSLTSSPVTGLRPNTRYSFRVVARNDIGMSPYSPPSAIVKTKADKPDGSPENVNVVPLTRTSVGVTWEQPPPVTWNGNIQGYHIQYRQTELSSYQEKTINYPEHTIVLSDLVKFVNYEIRIIAYNSVGESPPSKLETVYVGEAAPTAPPEHIMTNATSSTDISVMWHPPPPDTQNGELSGYKISYWLAKNSAASALYNITRETNFALSNLNVYSDYAISVLAYNLAGEGPSSNITYQRTKEGLPESPGPLVFSNITMVSLNVSWTEPLQANGLIMKYELVYFTSDQQNARSRLVKLTIPGNQTYAFIKDLEENQEYVFNVSARTSVGMGPGTNRHVMTGPQPGSPGAPTKPALTVRGESVNLRWTATSEGHFPIYGYLVQAKEDAARKWDVIYRHHSRDIQATIYYRDLNPDTGYLFRVIALNNIGISAPSPVSDMIHSPPSVVPQESLVKPFHSEWWFLVIVALAGLVLILLIISCLCLVARRGKTKKSTTNSITNTAAPELVDGGFTSIDIRRSNKNFAGIKIGSVRNTYARSPPRPSPASVAYSDDETVTISTKPTLPDDQASSVTDKPSDLGDSTETSDDESDNDSMKHESPSSPPPPPFSATNYIREPSKQLWQPQAQYTAYSYTDSEAESSQYAMSLTGGHVVSNNTPGSRVPVPTFSSFV